MFENVYICCRRAKNVQICQKFEKQKLIMNKWNISDFQVEYLTCQVLK